MLRGDHEPEVGYKHARWNPRGWCKHSCIPITIILILIVLVVLVPLMEQKEADNIKSVFCPETCRFSLVESIPEGLVYPSGTTPHSSIHNVWLVLIQVAKHSIDLGSFYWTLRNSYITLGDPSSQEGEEVFQALLKAGLEQRVNIRITQNYPSQQQSSKDTDILSQKGAAEVRSLNFPKLVDGGVLHTKFWIIDKEHFYVGSANMDWRSLTQVKELGLVVYNCSCLAADLTKIFEAYWFLGTPDAQVPKNWPDTYQPHFNVKNSFNLTVNSSSKADMYMSSPEHNSSSTFL